MPKASPESPWLLAGNSTGDTDRSDGTGIVQQNRLLFMSSQYLMLTYLSNAAADRDRVRQWLVLQVRYGEEANIFACEGA